MIRVGVCGALGRMGNEVVTAILEQDDLALSVAVEADGHPLLGTRIGDIEIVSSPLDHLDEIDVLVDFTNPEGAVWHLSVAEEHGKPCVVGVTALSEEQMKAFEKGARKIPVVYAPNMSVGINFLFDLVSRTASVLGEGFDVEIVEMHHRMKKDAPSGTAAKIADIVAQGKAKSRKIYGRQGLTGERDLDEIGIHALRGGGVVGEHTVIFAADGERLEITHKAGTRRAFSSGVMKAIRFVMDQKPGLYDMKDVLGIG